MRSVAHHAVTFTHDDRHCITPEQRAERSGHRPVCIWLTGLSGAGKTTVARGAELRLHARGLRTMLLDGDVLRSDLSADLDFSPHGRTENLRRASIVARYLTDAGSLVLCAFVSPHADDRARARRAFAPGRFFEVYVKCSVETCRRRDPKGLYQRSQAGELKGLTGVDAPYEEPASPDLVLDTNTLDSNAAIAQLETFVIATLG